MERLTREDTIMVCGKEKAACNYKNDDCNDSCMYGRCRWQEKANMLLKEYEDTELTPEQIIELKERDKPRKIELNAGAPTGPVCGRRVVRCYDFCPDCGQRMEQ